jgi:hypothetical protein
MRQWEMQRSAIYTIVASGGVREQTLTGSSRALLHWWQGGARAWWESVFTLPAPPLVVAWRSALADAAWAVPLLACARAARRWVAARADA